MMTVNKKKSVVVLLSLCYSLLLYSVTHCKYVSALSDSVNGHNMHMRLSAYSDEDIAQAKLYLSRHTKPAVVTIHSPDGDIVDCVLRHQQPAFDHPLLHNHTLQERPTSRPTPVTNSSSPTYPQQLWHTKGSCPHGTVPIRRLSLLDVLRMKAGEENLKQKSNFLDNQLFSNAGHEYAVATWSGGEDVYGTAVIINVWKAELEAYGEMSVAQLWLTAGQYEGTDLNTIETGWQIQPNVYGDYNPRFFSYWTNAFYTTGCFDLRCPGFVQVSNVIMIGGTVTPVSEYKSNQYDMDILVWRDRDTGNWWLKYHDTEVGYWPGSLFPHLSKSANVVQWGGEIKNIRSNGGQHTSTQMGSGHFAHEGWEGACFARNIQWMTRRNKLKVVKTKDLVLTTSNSNCYDISSTDQYDNWGTAIFFGGPGRNPSCP